MHHLATYRWKLYRNKQQSDKTILATRILCVEDKAVIQKFILPYSRERLFVGDVIAMTTRGFTVVSHPMFIRAFEPVN